LADENIPKSVVSWLRENGHDILKAQDVGLTGATDSDLVNWSLENERVIITLDEDFGRFYRQLGKPLGVILIRTHPPTPERINHLLSVFLTKVRVDKHTDELMVVTDRGIRIGTH